MPEKTFKEVNYLYHTETNTFTADERYEFRFTSPFFCIILNISRQGVGDRERPREPSLVTKAKEKKQKQKNIPLKILIIYIS